MIYGNVVLHAGSLPCSRLSRFVHSAGGGCQRRLIDQVVRSSAIR